MQPLNFHDFILGLIDREYVLEGHMFLDGVLQPVDVF